MPASDKIINRTPESVSRCGSCGAQIAWLNTWRGKKMPVNIYSYTGNNGPYGFSYEIDKGLRVLTERGAVETIGEYLFKVKGWVSHFSTCPFAKTHRRR